MTAARSLALVLMCAWIGACLRSGRPNEAALGFEKSSVFEAQNLGTITGIAGSAGGIVVAGKRGAVRVSLRGDLLGSISFQIPKPTLHRVLRVPGHVEPFFLGGEAHFLSRGGNWHEVGLYGPAGVPIWTYTDEAAPDWLTGADVDGDGELEYFVGMNGAGGLRRIDPAGRVLWQVAERNVWRVEALQADGDADLELVHSNDEGELWLRAADGAALRRLDVGRPIAWAFDVLASGDGRDRILVGAPDHLSVIDPAGSSLELAGGLRRDGFFDLSAAVIGAKSARSPLGWELLAALSSQPIAGLAVLSIHDADARLVHEEVLEEPCASLAWVDHGEPELWVGCEGKVWRYRARRGAHPVLTADAFLDSGTAWGPLRFGDPPFQAKKRLELHPLVACRNEECSAWTLRLREREFVLLPEFEDEGLARLLVFGVPAPAEDWDDRVRADWQVLSETFMPENGPGPEYPEISVLDPEPGEEDSSSHISRTSHAHGRETALALFGIRGKEGRRFGAIVKIAPHAADAAPASPAPGSD